MANKKKKLDDLLVPSYGDWLASHGQSTDPLLMPRVPGQMPEGWNEGVRSVASHVANIPRRALEASETMRQGGPYNPKAVVEAAMLPMGATPFSAPQGAIGAGPSWVKQWDDVKDVLSKSSSTGSGFSPLPKKMDPEMAKALEKAGVKQDKKLAAEEITAEEALAVIKAALSEMPLSSPAQAAMKWEKELKNSPFTPKAQEGILWHTKPKKPALADLESHFKPLDWRGSTSPHATEASRGIPARAGELGFNPEFPLYKGRGSGKPSYERSLPDPAKKHYERGLFFSDDPSVAREYGKITEYVARAKNPAQIDWQKAAGRRGYSTEEMDQIVDTARYRGHDLLQIKNVSDLGGKQDQFVVLDPSIMRRPHATFDPANVNKNDLLAGLAALGATPLVVQEAMKDRRE